MADRRSPSELLREDEPIVWYEGTGTSDRRFMQGDERGSIVSVSNSSATSLSINAFDEYGIPGSSNAGRFQYTGQTWLADIGLYHYKARMYSPTLGRFMQTDPIGYGDGLNWYNYVGSDPVNFVDPLGLRGVNCQDSNGNTWLTGEVSDNLTDAQQHAAAEAFCASAILVTAAVTKDTPGSLGGAASGGGGAPRGSGNPGGGGSSPQNAPCPVVNPGSMGTMTETQVGMSRPGWQTINAYRAAQISLSEAQANFPRSQLWNGPGDAWRHFRWNFSMAQSMGSRAASAYANAHEVSNPNDAAEHAMDMYNNVMGRAFGSNPAYADLSPSEAADLALRSGCLQTSK